MAKAKIVDSKVVVLNGREYVVYLKEVNVKLSKSGEHRTAIRAFVREL